jgi:hypothetical protein
LKATSKLIEARRFRLRHLFVSILNYFAPGEKNPVKVSTADLKNFSHLVK